MTIQITSNDIKFMDAPEFPVRLLQDNHSEPCVICHEIECSPNCNSDEWFIPGVRYQR